MILLGTGLSFRSSRPGFPPGFTNHRAFVAAMSAPPLSPTTPRPGYQFLAGSVADDRFFFVNEPLIHASISVFVDYVANRTIRDVNAAWLASEPFQIICTTSPA